MHIIKTFFVFFLLASVAYSVYPSNWGMHTKTKLTSPCNAFKNFVIDPRSRPVGDNSWPNGCPAGRYMTAVWSSHATEPFESGKCCGTGVSDEYYSWQISNLQFYGGGSDALDQPWNIECSKQSVITGFRFMSDDLGLRLLSDVRCSMLINKLVNQSQCTIMDFTKQAKDAHTWNGTWTHECPTGSAMTAVYDDQGFVEVKKVKCCQLFDNAIRPGWKSSFHDNLSGFLQSKADNFDYTVNAHNLLQSPNFLNTGVLHRGVITSPAIKSDKRICLLVQTYLFEGTSLSVNVRTNTSVRTVKTISTKIIATTKLLVNEPKTYQLELVGNIVTGYIWIISLEFADEIKCDIDRCSHFPPAGCGVNEICQPLPPRGLLDCACLPGYVKIGGVCMHTPTQPSTAAHSSTPTTPKDVDPDGKSGDRMTDDPRRPYWTEANTTTGASTVQTTATLEREKDAVVASVVPLWMYALTAALITIALAAIVILVVIVNRANRRGQQKRNKHHSFYDVHLNELSPTNMTSFSSQLWSNRTKTSKSSRSTASSYCASENIYRPYIDDLGSVTGVEGTTPEAYNNTLADDILREEVVLPSGCVLDTNNNEPIYTRIIRSISDATEIDVDALHGNQRHGATSCDKSLLRRRRLSHYTLDAPVYGEDDEKVACADSTSSEQATVERLSSMEEFFIPGDNEEDLIDELNELNAEQLNYTTQQLGEGAFGVVKLADYTDKGQMRKVAIKSIKERDDYEITEPDRINLYQEAVIMMQFEHPNVISLVGVVVGAAPAMVMEYESHGSLHKYLRIINRTMRKKQLSIPTNELNQTFLRWAREIASGMEYLERLKFIHRDLACRNILLNGDFSCKISDFGLARGFLKDYQYYVSHGGQIPVKWTAPEAIQFKRYSCASDVWSFAVVLWEIWSIGKVPYSPWKNDQVITAVCEKGYRLPSPEGCPRVLHSIMTDSWNADRRKRPTFSQVRYCLSYSDERILGKEASLSRTRSRTICNLISEDQAMNDDGFSSRTG